MRWVAGAASEEERVWERECSRGGKGETERSSETGWGLFSPALSSPLRLLDKQVDSCLFDTLGTVSIISLHTALHCQTNFLLALRRMDGAGFVPPMQVGVRVM